MISIINDKLDIIIFEIENKTIDEYQPTTYKIR